MNDAFVALATNAGTWTDANLLSESMVARRRSSLPALAGPRLTIKSETTFCPSSGAKPAAVMFAGAVAARAMKSASSSRGHN